MTLKKQMCKLKNGEFGVISTSCHREEAMANRLKVLGFESGVPVRCVGRSPLGGMGAYEIKGAVIALRDTDASDLWITV